MCLCVFVQLKQLEMQLEQEYEEKQMVIHEKHDLEGLIATLCEQVSSLLNTPTSERRGKESFSQFALFCHQIENIQSYQIFFLSSF